MSNMNHRQYSHYESSTSRADIIANKSNRSIAVVAKWIVCFVFAFLFGQIANAQSNMIHGIVKDSITSEPLQYINIYSFHSTLNFQKRKVTKNFSLFKASAHLFLTIF